MSYKTIFFKKTISNKSFILDYFKNDLPKSTVEKIIQQMLMLEQHGLKKGYVKFKKFQNKMYKIRYNDGNNNARVYFIIIDDVIYYLYAFNKKTQKTPDNIKIKINNLKNELLLQIENKQEYLFNYVDLNKLILKYKKIN